MGSAHSREVEDQYNDDIEEEEEEKDGDQSSSETCDEFTPENVKKLKGDLEVEEPQSPKMTLTGVTVVSP